MLCPYCLNDVIFDKGKVNKYTCPHCKQEVPTVYVQETDTKRVTVSAVGFSGHGKSVCFASLFYFLDRLVEFWPKFCYMALDDISIRTVYDNKKLLSQGILPPPTPNNFPIPSIINFMKIPLFGDRIFLFYDISGESAESITNLTTYASFIKNSRMMTFFISLSDLNVDGEIKRDDCSLGGEMSRLLQVYINAYLRIGGERKSQDLLVVFTKGDRLRDMLPKDVWEYLRCGVSEIYGKECKTSDDDMLRHTDRLKDISDTLRKFVENNLKAKIFTNLAKEYFKSVNFIVISSLGAEPTDGRWSAIPKRVEDILIWLAYSQEESNKLTSMSAKSCWERKSEFPPDKRFSIGKFWI